MSSPWRSRHGLCASATLKAHLCGFLRFSFSSPLLIFLVNHQGPFVLVTAALSICFLQSTCILSVFWRIVLWWLHVKFFSMRKTSVVYLVSFRIYITPDLNCYTKRYMTILTNQLNALLFAEYFYTCFLLSVSGLMWNHWHYYTGLHPKNLLTSSWLSCVMVGLFSISQSPSAKPFLLFAFPNFSLHSS